MLDTTTFVGLDVHARSIKAVSLDVMTGGVRCATFGYDAGAVAEWVRSVDPKARCVYESGVTGFDLQKRLSGLGVDCVVGAVSKMIKPSADRRRKNDVSVNLFFTSFAKQAHRSRKGGFTGCANVFSPIPVTARRGRPSAGPSACRTCRLS